ncbi:nascent polypeptide-associated complex subunit alpha, muscle-specific form-like [Vidua macroura]|uniref:nascent polypeptide-associated complex subunit alpha, muscle-specific form-like n=1 Tax=Vidua macroura TaxID=187451 RepID=UPI0023A8A1D2|nr:nascent polypeptide-associated complex subunit alpha, muscle-specific form-like [Vidua macroura]
MAQAAPGLPLPAGPPPRSEAALPAGALPEHAEVSALRWLSPPARIRLSLPAPPHIWAVALAPNEEDRPPQTGNPTCLKTSSAFLPVEDFSMDGPQRGTPPASPPRHAAVASAAPPPALVIAASGPSPASAPASPPSNVIAPCAVRLWLPPSPASCRVTRPRFCKQRRFPSLALPDIPHTSAVSSPPLPFADSGSTVLTTTASFVPRDRAVQPTKPPRASRAVAPPPLSPPPSDMPTAVVPCPSPACELPAAELHGTDAGWPPAPCPRSAAIPSQPSHSCHRCSYTGDHGHHRDRDSSPALCPCAPQCTPACGAAAGSERRGAATARPTPIAQWRSGTSRRGATTPCGRRRPGVPFWGHRRGPCCAPRGGRHDASPRGSRDAPPACAVPATLGSPASHRDTAAPPRRLRHAFDPASRFPHAPCCSLPPADITVPSHASTTAPNSSRRTPARVATTSGITASTSVSAHTTTPAGVCYSLITISPHCSAPRTASGNPNATATSTSCAAAASSHPSPASIATEYRASSPRIPAAATASCT